MKKLFALLLLISSISLNLGLAQTRYLQPVFDDVSVSTVLYGQNATVLGFPTVIKQPLVMDVYQPVGDTETSRPVVLFLHTGNFLPFYSLINGSPGFNGSCGGTIKDSVVVESCKRLAKMGYVACAVDYRLGWNPVASSDVQRRFGIINAAYRGIQDVRTCIRYLRKSADVGGNPLGVDVDKIVVFGQGTGGYISLNVNVLDNYLKIPFASEGKFLYDHDGNAGTPPIPMVVEGINGDIYGTSVGILPTTGDTLCHPNHVGYSSDFALAVNLGGACADSAWVDPGQKPLISFHVPQDPYAPYGEGTVLVPGLNLPVVKVQGSYIIQQLSEAYGNNDSYIGQPILDLSVEQQAAFAASPIEFSDPTPGVFPFNQPIVNPGPPAIPLTSAPWEWTSFTGNGCINTKSSAITYIDTIFRFYAPRACFALGLQGCIDQVLSGKEPLAENIQLTLAPNPAVSETRISVEAGKMIQSIEVYDRTGRMVRQVREINNDNWLFQRNNLNAGMYVVKVSFEEGFVTKMVTFN